ncbi:MAG: tRNA (N(6)-L-threonylcarbamoyladenosine(37)-C(2))-methylthiotransferase MtaB [Candidatus Mariimomonas ferrooxydans]
MKVAIYTLGCKVNQAESASIEGTMRGHGHEIVQMHRDTDRDRPDVCIINTCTVTSKSDYQSRQMIRRAVKSGARVIATGCYAQLRPKELLKINGLDFILGNSEKDKLQEYFDKLSSAKLKTENLGSVPNCNDNESMKRVLVESPETPMKLGPYCSNRSRAFLKIQDGCNFSCSYCTVPMARGKSRSLNPADVLKAVEKLVADGYEEIVLTGIHIGSYGLELKPESSLLGIVNKIINDNPLIRLRLSSIEPQEFKKDFLSLIKQGGTNRSRGRLCPHLHIPLQSGSDNVLKLMKRGYNISFFKKLINEIVMIHPDISIGTDIIVGFPGESENDFKDTIKFLEELPLSYIHVFPYSQRPYTRASTLKGQISNEIKKKRVNIILEIARKKKNAYLIRHLGKTLNVIVERKTATTCFYRAISENYIRPLVKADNLIEGKSLLVKAVSISDGELISMPV